MSAVVGSKVIKRPGNTAICDTGTTLCLVDSALCKAIYSQIPGAKYVPAHRLFGVVPDNCLDLTVKLKDGSFPVGDLNSLPAIEIGLGDPSSPGGEHRFSVYPSDLAFAEASPGHVFFFVHF